MLRGFRSELEWPQGRTKLSFVICWQMFRRIFFLQRFLDLLLAFMIMSVFSNVIFCGTRPSILLFLIKFCHGSFQSWMLSSIGDRRRFLIPAESLARMDVCNPPTVWIGGSCYRKNPIVQSSSGGDDGGKVMKSFWRHYIRNRAFIGNCRYVNRLHQV